MKRRQSLLPLLLLALATLPCGAAIVYDAPGGLTSAPSGDRGWNETGSWQVGGGVAVAPHYFLTAQHLGGAIGNAFVLDGVSYPTVSIADVPNTDLRVVKIAGTFPTYAPLYRGAAGSEANLAASLVGFGHYAQGQPVTTSAGQVGWMWGAAVGKNHSMNTIRETSTMGGPGQDLDYTFDPLAGREEGIYTAGDSGGGMFVNTGGAWRLAGVTYGITQFYTQANDASAIVAAIYKPNGLFIKNDNNAFVPATEPQHGYASEVAAYLPQIDKLLGEPLPGDTNHDGVVDFTDLLNLAQHYDKAGTFETGDFNADGRVGFDDLLVLAQNYGQTINNPPVATIGDPVGAQPVPEPGVAVLVAVAMLALRRRRPIEEIYQATAPDPRSLEALLQAGC